MSEFNLKSTTIEKSLELVKGLLDKIAAPAAEELGLMISDNIKHRRLKNQIKNLDMVRKIVQDNNVTLKQVNLKVLFPYLEGIAIEEDDELHDMWANLFVNYIDSKSNLKLTVYPSILKQLSTKEVEILKEGNKISGQVDHAGRNKLTSIRFEDEINLEELNNLERLGLINLGAAFVTADNNISRNDTPKRTKTYFISGFGIDLIEACTIKNK